MSKLSSSLLVQALPLLRAPLIINNIVACTLSFVHDRATYITQGVFLVLSLVFSLGVCFNNIRIKRRQAVLLEDDAALRFNASIFLPVFDLFFGVALLTLYIIATCDLTENNWYWGGLSLIGIYATFGSLVAWAIHFVLAIGGFRLWFQYSQSDKPRCPHCNNEIRKGKLPEFCAVKTTGNKPDARARDAYVDQEALINETGEYEGDRLILSPANEQE